MLIEIKLRELINESLGVSDDLYDFVNGNVIQLLIEDVNIKKKEFTTHDGLKQFNNKVDIVFCGKKIHIYYTFYGFLGNIRYNRYRSEHGDIFSNATSVFSDKNNIRLININILSVSGTIDKNKLSDSLMHEFEHIYEKINYGKELLPKDKNYRDKTKYLMDINVYKRILSRIIYYGYKFEQDTFVNGLYGELKSNNKKVFCFDDIKKTYCYKEYKKMLNALSFLNKHKGDYELLNELPKFYNGTIDKFIQQYENASERFLRKIGRVIVKVRDEYMDEGIIFTMSPTLTRDKLYLL